MDLILRPETAEDHYAVEALTREAFWKFWETDGRVICDEHLLVHRLRKAPVFIPELNIAAVLDGKIAGHIIYAKSKVAGETGTETETITFGPLSVLPEHQGKGIGQALMRHTFDKARALGYRAVIIYGHPGYYPRVGFKPASDFGITDPDGNTFDHIMALPLYDGALDGVSGRYIIDPVYLSLSQEDVLEFDKRFPYKEPHVL
jgi:predicted N-acetyltransferase YhbS